MAEEMTQDVESVNKSEFLTLGSIKQEDSDEELPYLPVRVELQMENDPTESVEQEWTQLQDGHHMNAVKVEPKDEFVAEDHSIAPGAGSDESLSPSSCDDKGGPGAFTPDRLCSSHWPTNVTEAHNVETTDTLSGNNVEINLICESQNCSVQLSDISHKCDKCNKCFTQHDELLHHLKLHSEKKNYMCEICGKCFAQRGNLKTHLRIHSGEVVCKCEDCGKCFTDQSSFRKHLKIHTGVRAYKCDDCGKSFTLRSTLARHIKFHSGEKNEKCEICGKYFIEPYHLKRHLKVAHSCKGLSV